MASITTPMDAQAIAATLTEQLGRPELISDSAPIWWNGIARSSLTMNQYFETLNPMYFPENPKKFNPVDFTVREAEDCFKGLHKPTRKI